MDVAPQRIGIPLNREEDASSADPSYKGCEVLQVFPWGTRWRWAEFCSA